MWYLGVHGRRWTLDGFFRSFYLESEYANGVVFFFFFFLQFTSSKLSSSGVLSHYQGGKRGYEDSTKPAREQSINANTFF